VRILEGLLVGVALGAACVIIDPNAKLCALGEDGCSCTVGGGCDPGLTCREGMCVDPDAPMSTTGATTTSDTQADTDPSTTEPDDTTGDETGHVEAGPNYLFVTSTVHIGGSLGGLEGADALCQARADAAGLAGTYRAWLSGPGVDARDRFAGARGWVRTDGKPFANSITQIVDGKFWYPPTLDENGDLPASWEVWTGTDLNGIGYDHGGNFCSGWTSEDAEIFALQGDRESARPWWTDSHIRRCNETGRLYCLGVDQDFEVTFEPVEGRRAFVSSGAIGSDGGLAAADALCQSEANAAGLQGSFLALLATTTESPASRFDVTGAPWVRVDGVPLFPVIDPMGALLQTPLALRANGTTSTSFTWLGSSSATQVGGNMTCEDWTATTGHSMLGTALHINWAGWSHADEECTETRPVLCFEE
jgi:hypothetical protein